MTTPLGLIKPNSVAIGSLIAHSAEDLFEWSSTPGGQQITGRINRNLHQRLMEIVDRYPSLYDRLTLA
jgi:hypothetical protein